MKKGDVIEYMVKEFSNGIGIDYQYKHVRFQVLNKYSDSYKIKFEILNSGSRLLHNDLDEEYILAVGNFDHQSLPPNHYTLPAFEFLLSGKGEAIEILNLENIKRQLRKGVLRKSPERMAEVNADFANDVISYHTRYITMIFRQIPELARKNEFGFVPHLSEIENASYRSDTLTEENHGFEGEIIFNDGVPSMVEMSKPSPLTNVPQVRVFRIYDISSPQKVWIRAIIRNGKGNNTSLFNNIPTLKQPAQNLLITDNYVDTTWQINLYAQSDILQIIFDYPQNPLEKDDRYLHDQQISLFAEAGDTVTLELDFDDFDSYFLKSTYEEENQVLKSLNRIKLVRDTSHVIEMSNKNLKILEGKQLLVSNSFFRILEKKIQFLQLYSKSLLTRDFLEIKQLSTFLGETEIMNHLEYRDFLVQYTRKRQQFFLESWTYPNLYESTKVFLNGWDEEYYLAKRILSDLEQPKNFSSEAIDLDYHSYQNDYSKSIFLPELKLAHRKAKIFSIGSRLPKQIIKQIRSLPVSDSLTQEFLVSFIKDQLPNRNYLNKDYPIKHLVFIDKEYLHSDYQKMMIHANSKREIYLIGIESKLIDEYSCVLDQEIFVSPKYRINSIAMNSSSNTGTSFATWIGIDQWKDKISFRTLLIGVGATVCLFLILFLLFWILSKRRERKVKLTQRLSELELIAVRSRMNPHFLFNSLTSIQSLINSGKIDDANTYLAKFGEMIRKILENSSETTIGLNEEIDFLKTYLSLEQLRYQFDYEVSVDDSLDVYETAIPPLLVQPQVENAVNHGISKLGKQGFIKVSFSASEQMLIVQIEDNGPGFGKTGELSNGFGKGIQMTKQKIDLLSKHLGIKCSFTINDNAKTGGTLVKLTLPL